MINLYHGVPIEKCYNRLMVKRKFFWVSSYLVLLSLFLSGCLFSKNPLSSIKKLISEGKYEEAIVISETFLSETPSSSYSSEVTYLLGKVYLKSGNSYEAIRVWKNYLKNFPKGKHREEIESIIKKWERKVGHKYSYMEKEVKTLSIAYKKILGKNIPPSKLYVILGNIYWEEGRKKLALSLYKKAIKLNPSIGGNSMIASRLKKFHLPVPSLLEVEDENILSLEKVWEGEWEKEEGNPRSFKVKGLIGTIISGKVKNKGENSSNSVRLVVTLYDFYDRILASKEIFLGNIPSEKFMPFSVIFNGIGKGKIHSVDYLILENTKEGGR